MPDSRSPRLRTTTAPRPLTPSRRPPATPAWARIVDTGTILVRSPAPPGQLGVGSVQLGPGGTPALSDGLQLGAVCGCIAGLRGLVDRVDPSRHALTVFVTDTNGLSIDSGRAEESPLSNQPRQHDTPNTRNSPSRHLPFRDPDGPTGAGPVGGFSRPVTSGITRSAVPWSIGGDRRHRRWEVQGERRAGQPGPAGR